MNLADLRTNLSYVLHEPSTSNDVEGFARRIIAWESVMQRAVRSFDLLTDAEMRRRIVLLAPATPPTLAEPSAPFTLLSLHLGAWPLLQRAAAMSLGPETALSVIELRFIDETGCPNSRTMTLFRAPARLCLDQPAPGEAASWFASLVIRPGAKTLQLRLDPLSESIGSPLSAEAYTARVRHLAESAIRSHVEQWQCPGKLWDRPAEQVLPEFRAG